MSNQPQEEVEENSPGTPRFKKIRNNPKMRGTDTLDPNAMDVKKMA